MSNKLIISDTHFATDPSASGSVQSGLDQPDYSSARFPKRNEFLSGLLHHGTTINSAIVQDIPETLSSTPIGDSSHIVILDKWKNTENISARLLAAYDDVVLLECLVDRDNMIFEEREFKASLFDGYNVNIGQMFFIRFFERKNEIRLEVHDDKRLTSKKDFPKKDFAKLFAESKLFKK
jgi:hypothetical protein